LGSHFELHAVNNLFVTGAAGFTGVHLVAAARLAGYEVVEYAGQLEDFSELQKALDATRPTHVIHLAGISAVTHQDELAFYQVNVLGTQNLLRACEKLSLVPQKIVIASSANIYGNASASPVSETALARPVNHYAISKLASEHVAQMFVGRLPIVIARPFNYTGVGHDQRFVVPKIIDAFRRKLPLLELGNVDVEREFNDVRFVVTAYLGLLEKALPGEVYNICTGLAFPLKEILRLSEEISGHRLEMRQNPAFMRSNEIAQLFGDPRRLRDRLPNLPMYRLEETIRWMLSVK
jgi:GDP-6-deoxy-D-talose 4-dehydrogenase